MRKHLKKCIEQKCMAGFPRTTVNQHIFVDKFFIKLFCMCRMPEVYADYMVECSGCANWFHYKCVNFTVESSDNWFCDECNS